MSPGTINLKYRQVFIPQEDQVFSWDKITRPDRDSNQSVHSWAGRIFDKPRSGLFTSSEVGDRCGWLSWLQYSWPEFRIAKNALIFVVNPEAEVYDIGSDEDYYDLRSRFPASGGGVDWFAVSKNYDGVHYDPEFTRVLDGWDCEQTVWFNPQALTLIGSRPIKNYRLGPMLESETRPNPYNAINDFEFTCEDYFDSAESARSAMKKHYPKSVKNTPEMIKEWTRVDGQKVYETDHFFWLGEEGRMLKIEANDESLIHPLEGNIFDDEKLCAVNAWAVYGDEKIALMAGYVHIARLDCCDVLERYGNESDYDYYEWSEDDAGKLIIQVRDGNHRTFGALSAGDAAYVYVTRQQIQEYHEWIKAGRPNDDVAAPIFKYFDISLI